MAQILSCLRVIATLLCLIAVTHVVAECECGYTSSVDDSTSPFLFTDIIESDFLHIKNVSLDTDWRRQNFSVTAEAGRGPYGMNFTIDNVDSNPILDLNNWTGPGTFGGDPGLQLSVGGGIPSSGYVQVAEIDSSREDLLWGSFRAAMKLTLTPGTCSAFFWYFNDSQEIDMEFLSSQFVPENNTFPVNLVLQSAQSVQAGFQTAATGNYIVANLPFNPTDGFHEYRIDFVPENVIFYGDGVILAKMNTSAVPTMPGHMILTQWSNGNPLWSFGPPPSDSVITVSYVKAYFNSSDLARQTDWEERCKDPSAAGAICAIPDQTAAPNPATQQGIVLAASTYFFSDDKNKTINQTVYHKNGIGAVGKSALASLVMFVLLFSIFL